MNRNTLAATTALLAAVYAAADVSPVLVTPEAPPTALGMTAGETVTVALLAAQLVGILAMPGGALAVGYLFGGDLVEQYQMVLSVLTGGGALGGVVGTLGVAAAGGVGGPLLAGLAVRTALKAAVGFAITGFAGAGLAHVHDERTAHATLD